jgi:hypothetical protein
MGVKGETFPHPSVVDDYLSTIDPEEVNQLLVELFISCQKSKIFYNHCATLLPHQSFHIGVEGFRSRMKFAKDRLEQLVNVLWIEINASQCLQRERIQFRYQFDTS